MNSLAKWDRRGLRASPPSRARGQSDEQLILKFRRGRAIVSHQHGKTRRIRFVTPTKLPYPWNLMS